MSIPSGHTAGPHLPLLKNLKRRGGGKGHTTECDVLRSTIERYWFWWVRQRGTYILYIQFWPTIRPDRQKSPCDLPLHCPFLTPSSSYLLLSDPLRVPLIVPTSSPFPTRHKLQRRYARVTIMWTCSRALVLPFASFQPWPSSGSILPLRFQKRGSLLWYSKVVFYSSILRIHTPDAHYRVLLTWFDKERDQNGCGHLPFLSFPRHRSILRPCRALIPPFFILRYGITLLVPNQPLQ